MVSKALVTEHALRAFRGRLMRLLAVAWAGGYVFAYLIGYLLSGTGPDAWRWMLAVSAVPALLVLVPAQRSRSGAVVVPARPP